MKKLSAIINAINSDAYRFGGFTVDSYCVKTCEYCDTMYFTIKGNTLSIFESNKTYDIYDGYGDIYVSFSHNSTQFKINEYGRINIDC